MKSIITGILNFFRLLLQPLVRILIRTQELSDQLNVMIRRAVGKYFGTFVDFGDLTDTSCSLYWLESLEFYY